MGDAGIKSVHRQMTFLWYPNSNSPSPVLWENKMTRNNAIQCSCPRFCLLLKFLSAYLRCSIQPLPLPSCLGWVMSFLHPGHQHNIIIPCPEKLTAASSMSKLSWVNWGKGGRTAAVGVYYAEAAPSFAPIARQLEAKLQFLTWVSLWSKLLCFSFHNLKDKARHIYGTMEK